jgi:hypothetical protein
MLHCNMFIPAVRRKKNEPEPLSAVIEKWLAGNKLEQRFLQTDIKIAWAEMMGVMVARHTSNISLENKVLKIRVDNAPLRQELFMSRSRIVAMVNKRAGRQIALDCLVY